MYYVYIITDPRNSEIFYVGQTNNFDRRKLEHLRGTDQLSGMVIADIIASGELPSFSIVAKRPTEDAAIRCEAAWIDSGMESGWPLKNAGAVGGYEDREIVRERLKQVKRAVNGVGLRTGEPLTELETRRLVGMMRNDYPIRRIADILKRSPLEIERIVAGLNQEVQ